MTDSVFAHDALAARSGLVLRAARWVGSAFLAAGLLVGSNAALAANATFTVDVQSIPTTVSVSRPGLITYAAFTVSIQNTSGNTSNAIRFSGSADVSGDLTAANGNAGATATYVETIPTSACTPTTPGGTTIQCNFGQMKNGANNSFVVIFAAPTLAAAAQWAADAKINFSWTLDYSSGNSSGTPSSLLCNGTQVPPPCAATNSTGLVTTQNDKILEGFLTYIPSFGGTFFTGTGSSVLGPIGTNLRPTALTKLTKLFAPNEQRLTTAQADVTVAVGGLTSATTTTITAVITVPNNDQLFGTYAVIELRRDASTIASGAKIANAAVLYSHDDAGTPTTLPHCPTSGDPSGFTPPVCVVWPPTEFTKKNAPTPDDVGDWLFVIHALENGRLAQ